MNGYSFIVYRINGNKRTVILKKSFDNFDIQSQIESLKIEINSVVVIWCTKDVELIPVEVFTPKNSINDLFTISDSIATAWKSNPIVISQLEALFGNNISHHHLIEQLYDELNSVRIVQQDDLVYITVTNNTGLESYFIGQFNSVADVIYYINKLTRIGKNLNYYLIGDNKKMVETIEKYITVNGILSKNPILAICE